MNLGDRVQAANERGIAAEYRGDLLSAELAFGEAVTLLEPMQLSHVDDLATYFACLSNLADVLTKMKAGPEVELYRMLAVQTAKQLFDADPDEFALHFAHSILRLAEVYRGPWLYMIPHFESPDGKARFVTDPLEMTRLRRNRLSGSLRWPLPWVPAPHWHLKGEWVLTELVSMARGWRKTDVRTWDPILALGLNLLGEAYQKGERYEDAIPSLTEAESLYVQLTLNDTNFQGMLADTRELLSAALNPKPAFMVVDKDLQLRPGR